MELKDPLKDRKIKTVPLPYQRCLTPEQLFQGDSANYQILLKFLKRQGKLTKKLFLELVKRAKNIFQTEPNLIKIEDPVTIVGDIHGQFYDFIKLIEADVGGQLQNSKYLFLGDYVDRGSFSIEVLSLLFAIKIHFKNTIFLLRGNHECRQLTSFFNFRTECLNKYDQQVYEAVMELFDTLPIAALVNKKFLCLHGGISNDIQTIADIQKVNRVKQIPKSGLFCDLMWADPVDNDTGKLDGLVKANDSRGCSYYFGYQLAKNFLKKNGLLSIIRAHQSQQPGYKMYRWGGEKVFPTVVTIFSAPNYCDFYNNKGAVIKCNHNLLDIQQFIENPHPYMLPNFIDLFEWSIPFIAQKVTALMDHLIKPNREYDQSKQSIPLDLVDKRRLIQKIMKQQAAVTQQHIDIISLDGRTLDSHLIQSKQAKEYSQPKHRKSFDKKKLIDSKNQKRPTK